MENSKLLGPIEHVIVLMFENRSFDNMLGGLKPYGPDYEGVPPGWSNPDNKSGDDLPAFQAPTGEAARIMPFPDPNEDHKDMMAQIDGGSMKGFVNNYATAKHVTPADLPDIMQYYAAGPDGNIPITSALADAYAVSDQYHGAGPVQTWPNRLFGHCATPGFHVDSDGAHSAYINNPEYPKYPGMFGQMDLPNIFELFDDANTSDEKAWKLYYDGEWPLSTIVKYIYKNWSWFSHDKGNVFALRSDEYPDFFSDIENDCLSPYSFIEPRYYHYTANPFKTIPPNSNHPGSATLGDKKPAIDIGHGEQLLKEVYEALAANEELFKKTLLIITYDEHGGCSDHVTPPPATSPFTECVDNFDYTMYGPRVPAIFINPYIKQGSVLRPGDQPGKASAFDHTSIIASLRSHFGLGGPLTPRDASAPVFDGLVDVNNGLNPGPGKLPDIDLPSAEGFEEPEEPIDLENVDKTSLAYVMHMAVLEKRRRIKEMGY